MIPGWKATWEKGIWYERTKSDETSTAMITSLIVVVVINLVIIPIVLILGSLRVVILSIGLMLILRHEKTNHHQHAFTFVNAQHLGL